MSIPTSPISTVSPDHHCPAAADPELIGVPGVLGLVPITRSTLYAWIAAGRFPRPLPLSRRRHFWVRSEVIGFLERLGRAARNGAPSAHADGSA